MEILHVGIFFLICIHSVEIFLKHNIEVAQKFYSREEISLYS